MGGACAGRPGIGSAGPGRGFRDQVRTASSQRESAAGSSSGAAAAREPAACALEVSSRWASAARPASEGPPERPIPLALRHPGSHLTSAQVLSPEPRAPRCFPPAPRSQRPHPSPLCLWGAVHPEPEPPVRRPSCA